MYSQMWYIHFFFLNFSFEQIPYPYITQPRHHDMYIIIKINLFIKYIADEKRNKIKIVAPRDHVRHDLLAEQACLDLRH